MAFNTIPNFCSDQYGHAPDIASSYLVKWNTHSFIVNNKSYEVQMIAGNNNTLLCCPNVKCSTDIGAEVQVLTLNSSKNSITSSSFIVVNVGQQSSCGLNQNLGPLLLKLDHLLVMKRFQSESI